MKILMFAIFFLMIGALFIISENNLALKDSGNFPKFLGSYYSWISQLFDNSKSLAGYVVKMDWLPDEGG